MNESASEVETLFLAAREVSHPREREAFLARVCGENRDLRQRIERMLHAEEQADQFLADNPLELTESPLTNAGPAEKSGAMIGRYKLLQKIGEGGCGVVYMAEQAEPIRRRVAVKVIKLGMDTEQVIARFEAERQALALMDHPNISRVLDAGATDAGRPYFVMELVRGIRITEYCDQNNLSTSERLGLFISVTQAIQHAHQKGIIHRDIKPSNVLVTLHDGVPVPKVIDFGVAKAIEQKLTDKTLFTQFEQFIGTPAYTSPEQAEMSGLDIDTRSDIYSLGVLLYELLVGRTPFESQELLKSGLNEMRRIIREKEPSRPSTVLSTMVAQERTATALRRGASSPELVHQIKGDLDWIVMKCLEKDRTRRYESASGLATDIRNYLSHETVTARPPTPAYRLGKMVRRHKLAFAASAAVAAALIAGIVVSTWQAARAHRAELAANKEKESAEAVLQFFRANVLAAGRPEGQDGGLGIGVTLRQAIDTAESEITKSFHNRPLVEAAIRKTFGENYLLLGEPELGIRQLERALALRRHDLPADHPEILELMALVAKGYLAAEKLDRALPLLEEVLMLRRTRLGSNHPDTLSSMADLARAYFISWHFHFPTPWEKGADLLKKTLELRKVTLGLNHPDTLKSMADLGEMYLDNEKKVEALPLLEEAHRLMSAALGPVHPHSLACMDKLFEAYKDNPEKQRDALRQHEESIPVLRIKYGEDHPKTLWSMWNLSKKLPTDRALPLLDEILRLSTGKAGLDYLTQMTMADLGSLYVAQGQPDRAILPFEERLEFVSDRLGADHPAALIAISGLAWAHWHAGKFEDAVRLNEEALQKKREILGAKHPDTRDNIRFLADMFRVMGRLDRAEALYREILSLERNSLAMLGLAKVLTDSTSNDISANGGAGEPTREAHQLLRDYLTVARSRYDKDKDAESLEDKLSDVVEIYYRQNLFAEAEPLYREILEKRPDHSEATASLARLLADWAWADRGSKSEIRNLKHEIAERAREAERLLRDCLTKRLADTGAKGEWRVADVKSRLGGALVSVAATDSSLDAAAREATLDEAETLLLDGHQAMQEHKSVQVKYRRDALERLVRLYEARGEPDKLAEWRRKLADFDKPGSNSSAAVVEKP